MSDGARQQHPTFVQSLLAGASAGTAVDLLFFPLDTLKTRLQASQGFVAAGGFKGIYRGVGSVLVGSAPGAAAFFTTYDALKQALPARHTPINHVVSASLGEVVACLVRVPVEVVKSRTQTGSYGAHATSFDAFKLVLKHDGVKGLYRGFGMTIAREIPFTSIQFPLYEFLKVQVSRTLRGGRKLEAYEAALCGSFAGGVAAALTTPLDVLKTRVMLDMRKQDPSKPPPSPLTRLLGIYKYEGPRALFAGVVPRTLWISAGGAVFLGVYEWSVALQM